MLVEVEQDSEMLKGGKMKMKRTPRISIRDSAELLGLSQQTLRVFLQNGKFSEFATACKTSSKWTYYINEERLWQYLLRKEKKDSNICY